MAKNRSEDQTLENSGATTEAAPNGAAPAVAAPAPGAPTTVASNVIMVKDPDTGVQTRRTDYIRKCWTEKKWSRGQIAKHLSELNAQNGVMDPKNPTQPLKVPYQAVFAVLKKGAESYGGPVAVAPGAVAPQAPTVQAGETQQS